MPVTIDELQLKLTSDVDSTTNKLSSLASSLERLKGTVSGLADAYGDVYQGIDMLQELFGKSNNMRFKLNVDIKDALANIGKLKTSLQSVLAYMKVDNRKMAKDIASQFGIKDTSAISDIEKQLDSVTNRVIKYEDATKSIGSAKQNIESNIRANGKFFTEAEKELIRFRQEFGKTVIYISDQAKNGLGSSFENIANEFRGLYTFDKSKGISLDMSDMITKYPAFSDYLEGGNGNVSNMIDAYFKMLKAAFNEVKEKSFTEFVGQGGISTAQVRDEITQKVQEAADAAKTIINNFDKGEGGNDFSIKLGAEIDTEQVFSKLVTQFRLIFNQATESLNNGRLNIPLRNINVTFDEAALTASLKPVADTVHKYLRFDGIDTATISSKLNTITDSLQAFRAGLSGSAPSKYVLDSISRAVRVFNSLSKIDTARISVVIDSISAALPKLSASLSVLSEMDSAPGIKAISSFASAIAKLGNADASKAINNARSVADAISEAIAKLNKSETVRADIGNFMKNIRQLSSGTGSLNVNMKNMANHTLPRLGNSMKKSSGSARSLLYTFYKIRGVVWAIRRLLGAFGKSIEYASDIVEVANVVRNTFREAEGQIAEFVDGSHQLLKDMWADQGWDTENIPGITERIGMNELAVSRMASRFQAMGSAMGFPNEEMATMSLRLTQLAGDMASFYNVDVADVADDLNAVFTGQTRPMRQYGIDLTMATLSQYALSKGITDSVQTMTQAEKTMLRYEYVLEHLQMVNGDFAATASTWANQIRILKMNVQELGGVWGGVFVNAFKPFVQGLNRALTSVINFSKKIADALGAIFGWTIEITDRGMLDPLADMEDYADGAEDLADGLGGAAGSAKDLKKALSVLSFDELNQLNGDSSSGGSGGSGGSGAADAAAAAASGLDVTVKRVDTLMDKYKSNITSLFDLGRTISDTLAQAMENVDWQAAYDKARSFGIGLAMFLNGLITPRLFGDLGRHIANSINSALTSANAFAKMLDWENIGDSLISGFNEFFRNFDFELAADTVNEFVLGILDMATSAIEGADTQAVSDGIVTFIKNIKVADIAAALVDFFDALAGALFEILINSIIGLIPDDVKQSPVGQAVMDFLDRFANYGARDPMTGELLGDENAGKLNINTGVTSSKRSEIRKKNASGTGTGFGVGIDDVVNGTARAAKETNNLAVSFNTAKDRAAGLRKETVAFGKDASEVAKTSAGNFKDATITWVNAVGDVLRKTPQEVSEKWSGYAKEIRERVLTAFDFSEAIKFQTEHAFGSGGVMPNVMAMSEHAILFQTDALISHTVERLGNLIPGFEKVGKDAVGGLETGYNTGKTSFFANNVAKLGSELSTSAGDVSKALEPKGIEAVAGMISGWNIKLPSLKTLAGTLKNTLKDSIGDTSSLMKPIGSDVVSKITSGLTEGISGVKNTLSSFGQAILNNLPGGNEMYSTGKSIFQRFAEGISSVYIKTPHFTQSTSIWDTIKDKLGNVVASLPKISVSWWAKGGYFNGPNVIGVGEAGPEAVLPLSNGRAMSAIADSINKAGAGLDRTELTQAVAEGYVRAMMMNPAPPINVNAVLYTEDNEVLARAVNRGNQSIGYRQNPTAAY